MGQAPQKGIRALRKLATKRHTHIESISERCNLRRTEHKALTSLTSF